MMTYDRPSQATSHQSEPQEQYQSRFPGHSGTGIAEAIGAQSSLLNRVDDEHSKCRADAGDPVDELDMDITAVLG